MKELIEYIRFDFLKNELEDNHYFYSNSIYLGFGIEQENFIFKDEIIDTFNTYYLPFFQNFDRIDD